MSHMQPDIAIILVSWNTCDLTVQCIESLPAALESYTASIWVVDNASRDASVETIRSRFPDIQVIANSANVGFAAANNQAIQASTSRYVLLLNTDTVAQPGSIAALIRFADQHPRAGMVGPMLRNPDGTYQGSFADQPTITGELLSASGLGVRLFGPWFPNHSPQRAQTAQQTGYVQGACMLARRAAVEQVGLLDEQYFMYSEEPDWCLRMARAQWEIWYTPTAQIVHYGGQSTRQRRSEMVIALYRSKVRFFAKHYGSAAATTFCSTLLTILWLKRLAQQVAAMLRPSTVVGPAIGWHELRATSIRAEQSA
jgi:N-acetylglucosaminyl-diphospho-decaprenol L-rhamnosyltransferase